MKKERQSLLSNEPYKVDEIPMKVILVIRLPQLDEVEKAKLIEVNDKIVKVKDQQHTFNGVFMKKNSNEDIYKSVFKDLVSHFLSGESHMIQIIGKETLEKQHQELEI